MRAAVRSHLFCPSGLGGQRLMINRFPGVFRVLNSWSQTEGHSKDCSSALFFKNAVSQCSSHLSGSLCPALSPLFCFLLLQSLRSSGVWKTSSVEQSPVKLSSLCVSQAVLLAWVKCSYGRDKHLLYPVRKITSTFSSYGQLNVQNL